MYHTTLEAIRLFLEKKKEKQSKKSWGRAQKLARLSCPHALCKHIFVNLFSLLCQGAPAKLQSRKGPTPTGRVSCSLWNIMAQIAATKDVHVLVPYECVNRLPSTAKGTLQK